MIEVKTRNRGGGFITISQKSDDKQLSKEKVEEIAFREMQHRCTLLTVNNSTDTRKINPRMREVSPDDRIYTLVLSAKLKKK